MQTCSSLQMRESGTQPKSLIAQHPANANSKSYLLWRVHKLLLPSNKTMFYKSAKGLPANCSQKGTKVSLTTLFTHVITLWPLCCLHSKAPQNPCPYLLNFLKALTTDILCSFLTYVSIFHSPTVLYMVHKSKALCLFCSLTYP